MGNQCFHPRYHDGKEPGKTITGGGENAGITYDEVEMYRKVVLEAQSKYRNTPQIAQVQPIQPEFQPSFQQPKKSTHNAPQNHRAKRSEGPLKDEVDRNPNDPEVHYRYACWLYDHKKLLQCEKELQICLTLDDECGKYHKKYSDLLGFMGRVADSQIHFEKSKLCREERIEDEPEDSISNKYSRNPYEYNSNYSSRSPHSIRKQAKQTKNEDEQNLCVVCLSNTRTHMNKECGHLCVCEVCSELMHQECPICKHVGGEFMRVYIP